MHRRGNSEKGAGESNSGSARNEPCRGFLRGLPDPRRAIYAGIDLQAISAEFPEISRYTRVGRTVGPLPALSRELAEATSDCLGVSNDGTIAFDIVGQSNHGVCAVAMDPWAAYEHIERLDHICEIVLKSGVRAKGAGY